MQTVVTCVSEGDTCRNFVVLAGNFPEMATRVWILLNSSIASIINEVPRQSRCRSDRANLLMIVMVVILHRCRHRIRMGRILHLFLLRGVLISNFELSSNSELFLTEHRVLFAVLC